MGEDSINEAKRIFEPLSLANIFPNRETVLWKISEIRFFVGLVRGILKFVST
jgi:hypothetical protein